MSGEGGAAHALRYRADIDGLRALAVMLVILFHAGAPWLSGGFVGVDVFFVISGYLITAIVRKEAESGTFTYAGFYARRARRILPALFAMLAVCAIAGFARMLPGELEELGEQILATSLFGSNVHFWRDAGYFSRVAETKPLLHTWSLAVEEQFYLVLPVLMVWMARSRRSKQTQIIVGLIAASFALGAWTVQRSPVACFYLPATRAWELLLGSLLAVIPWPALPRMAQEFAGLSGVAAIGAAALVYDQSSPFPGPRALLPCAGAAAIIVGARESSLVVRALSWPPMVFIGKASYSLYLWHWPALVFATLWSIGELTGLERGTAVLVGCLLGFVSYRYVETPFRRVSAPGSERRVLVWASVATLFGIATGGLYVLGGGLSGRMPAAVARLAEPGAPGGDLSPCANATMEDIERGRTCELGARGGPIDFVLWGDSHALAIAPAVDEVAKRLGRHGQLVANTSCVALFGVDLAHSSERKCSDANAAFLRRLQTKPIDTILVASRWGLWESGVQPDPTLVSRPLLRDAQTQVPSSSENQAVFARGLERTLATLAAQSKHVIVVASVPEMTIDVPRVLAKIRWLKLERDLRLPRKSFEERQARVIRLFEMARTRWPVTVISPSDVLCDEQHCRVGSAKASWYADADHLSAEGARLLAPQLEQVFSVYAGAR